MTEFTHDDVCPDKDLEEMYRDPEIRAAMWREEKFGIPVSPDLYERDLGDIYTLGNGFGNGLPPASERSWRRGTWVSKPTSWYHREIDLWVETHMNIDRNGNVYKD